MDRPAPGVNRPLSTTPHRTPGSVRRTSYIDILWLPADGVEADDGTALGTTAVQATFAPI